MAPLLLMLALHAAGPDQEPVVRAQLQDEAIRAGETTVLRIDVETDGARARIQSFTSLPPGLELQSTRDFDQRQFGIPGGTRRFVSREFVLRARDPGRFRVPSVDVVVEGRTYATPSRLLTVMAASPAPGTGLLDEEGVVLRTWLDADTVVVGEQVMLEAEALFSPDARLRLRRAPEYEAPSPSGFWIRDLPQRRRPTTRIIRQERFEVQRFTRLLFPLAPGVYRIPPARLEYEVRRGLLYAPEIRERVSEPLELVVLPVPGPAPDSYTGAVGSYTVRGSLTPGRVPAGEAAVLSVEVEGAGNVKALPPPSLPAIEGVEVYPPGQEAETEIRDGALRGTKRFSWVLIPRETGTLVLPDIEYAYYDPTVDAFERATVGGLTLEVTAGSATPVPGPAPTLRYLATEPTAGDPFGWVRSGWFLAAQAIPLLLLGFAASWRRRGARSTSLRQLRRERRERLRSLEDRLDDVGVLAEAEAFARHWVARRLGLDGGDRLGTGAWAGRGVPDDVAAALRSVLDRLAAARYAPEAPDLAARRSLLRELASLLERLDRQTPPPARAGAVAASAAVALCLLAAGGVAAQEAPARAAPAGLFEAGVDAFDREEYARAVGAFERYVDARPDDPAGWYNLGTAYHHAGLRGYAVRAWLKVPSLDPRNQDVRHNLRVAGVAPELVAVAAPPLPLRSTELFLLASLAWWVTAGLGALSLIRGRPRAGMVAGVALLVTLLLAGGGWASTRDVRTVIVLQDATLRAGPTLQADPVAELEAGVGLRPVETRGGWLRARTLAGGEGWIEEASTAPL